MTWIDRLLAWHVRTAITLLHRRMSEAHGRVYWFRLTTTKPSRLRSGAYTPKAGVLTVGYGSPAEQMPLMDFYITREMFDVLTDSAIETRRVQDAQYAIVEEPR